MSIFAATLLVIAASETPSEAVTASGDVSVAFELDQVDVVFELHAIGPASAGVYRLVYVSHVPIAEGLEGAYLVLDNRVDRSTPPVSVLAVAGRISVVPRETVEVRNWPGRRAAATLYALADQRSGKAARAVSRLLPERPAFQRRAMEADFARRMALGFAQSVPPRHSPAVAGR